MSKLLKNSHPSNSRAIPEDLQNITVSRLKEMLPKNTNIVVTEEIVSLIQNMEADTGIAQTQAEEDVMSYMHLVGSMRGIGIKDLINAIKFCNLKRTHSNKEAWSITFPAKYNELVENNKQVDNHVAMYNGTKLVGAIDKDMLIPVHMQYSSYFHAAVKKQFEIMNGKAQVGADGKEQVVSPMVQHLAAKELAVLTKAPEEAKLDITINPGEAAMSAQEEMNEQLRQITGAMKGRLDRGESIIDVQQIGINFDSVGVAHG